MADLVPFHKVYSGFSILDSHLPADVMTSFKKQTDYNLRLKDVNGLNFFLDFDRFMDQAILLYLRYNRLVEEPLN